MQFLTKFSLKNPVAIIIICFLLMAGGIYSFTTLKSDLLPDIEFPQLSITVVYPGASPEDVNEKITKVLESRLKTVENVDQMNSQSLESVSRIQLSFPLETDMDKVTQSVNESIAAAGLPDNVTTRVDRFSFGAFPVINVALFPTEEGKNIDQWAEDTLKPELLKINGVNSVGLSGIPPKFLEIEVNKEKAQQSGIQLQQIKEAIQGAFFSFPAGTVEEESVLIPVRIDQRIEKIKELEELTFNSPITMQKVRLGDLAEVREVQEKTEHIRYNLQDSLSLLINKKQDANTVEVVDRVFDVLNKYEDQITYVVSFDQAEGIKVSIKELVEKGLFGALFASLAVLLFLRNFRATFIAIVSIPLSLLIAAIFLKWWGITLNVMSLAGMAVAVGRVVDDSIIVIENIYRRRNLEPSGDRTLLTIEGTKEMMSAILSSTLTSIVVFLPLGLVGGITGAFFMPFALTVVVALLASLIVSITIIPVLASVSFVKMKEHERESFYIRWYEKAMNTALKRKWIVILLAILLLGGSFPFVNKLGFIFLPNEKQKMLTAEVTLPSSTVLEKTNEISIEIEKEILKDQERYPKVFTSIGSYDYMTGTARTNRAQYFIELGEGVDVDEELTRVTSLLEGLVLKDYPDAVVSVQELQAGGPPSNNNVDIDLYSNNLEELEKAAKQVELLMSQREDLQYVKNNMDEKQMQWTVQLDHAKVSQLEISPYMVLGLISDQTRPVEVGKYTFNGVEQSIKLRYDRALQGKEELEEILLFTSQGPIPLAEIADIRQEEVVTSIQKLNERVFARVTAQVVGNDVRTVTADVIKAVEELELPGSISLETGGGSDETMQTMYDLLVAIGVAIGLVYITMLIFFGKARLPFVILTSLIFVPIGSIIALYAGNEPLSMSAMIGLLMLVGIVVTNAIVLVDRINQNRDIDKSIREAVIEAGKTRIRPILMTALATIAALLPLAFATPEGGLISRGLALVVIGGLTTSTLLTLIFVPVIYEMVFFRQHRLEQTQRKGL